MFHNDYVALVNSSVKGHLLQNQSSFWGGTESKKSMNKCTVCML